VFGIIAHIYMYMYAFFLGLSPAQPMWMDIQCVCHYLFWENRYLLTMHELHWNYSNKPCLGEKAVTWESLLQVQVFTNEAFVIHCWWWTFYSILNSRMVLFPSLLLLLAWQESTNRRLRTPHRSMLRHSPAKQCTRICFNLYPSLYQNFACEFFN